MVDRALDEPVTASPVAPMLVTVREAGALLGVGRTTTYELIAAGDLEVVHIGRSSRIPIASVEAYVQRLRQADAS